jgi:ketosteroid isomerase-like protein
MVARRSYDAIHRGDIAEIMANWHTDASLTYSGSISVENIFDLVGNNVVSVQWDNRPVNQAGEEFYVRGITVSTLRWGKVPEATTYVLDYQYLPRLWGEEKDGIKEGG